MRAPVGGIKGHHQLNDDELMLINEGKELAEIVGLYVEKLFRNSNTDPRWLSIGKTDLQKGFMSVFRSIAKPLTF